MFVIYKHQSRKCQPNFLLDTEELEDDGESKSEPVNFEESEDFDHSVDNSKTSGEKRISDSVQAAKIEPIQTTSQPQVKTIEKIQTGNSYR